jgi:PKD repeat protein
VRRALLLAWAAVLLLAPNAGAGTGGTSPGGGSAARLQGAWTMKGKITRADNVRGERKGQKVKRSWTFTPNCSTGPCSKVVLRRERSNKQVDKVTLKRSGSTYKGSGKFYVRLKCNGKTYRHGGIAYYSIKVRVTKSTTVQNQTFASAISASYSNSRRVNKTPCTGSIGRDAGTYSGKYTVAAPKASYSFTDDSMEAGTLDFKGDATVMKGEKVASWSWDFGDGTTSSLRNPKHHFPNVPGEYDVTLTVTDNSGLTGTITKHIPIE